MTDSHQKWQAAVHVSCKSFIAQNLKDPSGGFVPLEPAVGGAKPSSTDIAGYVSLMVQGQEILGPDSWGLIVVFWEYFPIYLEEYLQSGKMEILFPDQPLRLSVSRIGNQLVRTTLLLDQPRSAVCSEALLIRAMCDEACRVIQLCALKQILNGGSNDLISRIRHACDSVVSSGL
ncbi:MAG: hypothetical protein KDA29_07800 [Phycisphaerales bacterium]|nr:hypothetical protein [Phycisphaerales bacterium]